MYHRTLYFLSRRYSDAFDEYWRLVDEISQFHPIPRKKTMQGHLWRTLIAQQKAYFYWKLLDLLPERKRRS